MKKSHCYLIVIPLLFLDFVTIKPQLIKVILRWNSFICVSFKCVLEINIRILTRNDHISSFICPVIDWFRVSLCVAFQRNFLSHISSLQLVRNCHHWWELNFHLNSLRDAGRNSIWRSGNTQTFSESSTILTLGMEKKDLKVDGLWPLTCTNTPQYASVRP